jgi:hypothetical protein
VRAVCHGEMKMNYQMKAEEGGERSELNEVSEKDLVI